MLTIITLSDVWEDMAVRARTDNARRIVSTAYDLYTTAKKPHHRSFAYALKRARYAVNFDIEFGWKASGRMRSGKLAELPESHTISKRDKLDLRAVISDHVESALLGMYADGMTQGEIADKLGVSQPTIARRLNAALAELRVEYAA